jgi:hypothetical protein
MLEALSDNVKNLLGEVTSRFDNLTVLSKAVDDAVAVKEKARNEFAKFLVDVDTALHKIMEEVGPVTPDVPVEEPLTEHHIK